jgi:hypothetical protein
MGVGWTDGVHTFGSVAVGGAGTSAEAPGLAVSAWTAGRGAGGSGSAAGAAGSRAGAEKTRPTAAGGSRG